MKKSFTRIVWEVCTLIWFILLIQAPLMVAIEAPFWLQMLGGLGIGLCWSSVCQYFINLYQRAKKGE